jgi:flagellar basal-body rod protein FlgC
MSMGIQNNLSALMAFDVQMQVTANNIANVNTNEFDPSDVRLETGPRDQGVSVSEIRQINVDGPMVPGMIRGEDGSYTPGYVEGSGTDLTREIVDLSFTELAYKANLTAISSQEQMRDFFMQEMF